ncbi:MAG TPA: universal stress protein [Bacteroidetes bacterium]|nr:universal stress protein [Bacteroidota bacterium]
MFDKILFADDLSKRALKAMKVALDLARKYDAELIILNVREDFLNKDEMVMLRVGVSDFQKEMKEKAIAVRRKIEDDIKSLKAQDIKYQILLQEGKPADEIINTARERDIDLIVVGTHGTSILKGKLYGSIAKAVVSDAGRNVLAVWTEE